VATLTIRNIDESVKQALRERAARNGRSMEEEMRLLLSALDAGRATPSPVPAQAVPARAVPQPVPSPAGYQSLSGKRILLIISGGIAAYKSLDLIRRLRERGAEVRPVMTAGAQEFVTPLAVGALSPRSRLHRSVLARGRAGCRPHKAGARLRPDLRRPRHRRPDGEDGERPRQ
jgi:phosphopantothenoylcysteine decarboxylase/phosphopantothenate--cysteine ligase